MLSLNDRQVGSLSEECQAQGPRASGSVTRHESGLSERVAAGLEGRVSRVLLTLLPQYQDNKHTLLHPGFFMRDQTRVLMLVWKVVFFLWSCLSSPRICVF